MPNFAERAAELLSSAIDRDRIAHAGLGFAVLDVRDAINGQPAGDNTQEAERLLDRAATRGRVGDAGTGFAFLALAESIRESCLAGQDNPAVTRSGSGQITVTVSLPAA